MNEHLNPPGIHQEYLDSCRYLAINHDYKIQTLGKFEQEWVFVPWYWECALDGLEDERSEVDGYPASIFVMTETDIETLGVLAEKADIKLGDRLYLYENDVGFVCCTVERPEDAEIIDD